MPRYDNRGFHVGRRDFIKTTTMASMAATFPGSALLSQDTGGSLKSEPGGTKRKVLFLSDSPATFEKLTNSIRAVKEVEFLLNPVTFNYQKPQELLAPIKSKEADVILMCLPQSAFSYGTLPDSLGDPGIPMVLLAQNPDLILIDANFAAALRTGGANVFFATSQEQALEMLKTVAAHRILDGRKAIIYGRPFDSTSAPAHNISPSELATPDLNRKEG